MENKKKAAKVQELVKGLYINSEPPRGYSCLISHNAARISSQDVTEIMEKIKRSEKYLKPELN